MRRLHIIFAATFYLSMSYAYFHFIPLWYISFCAPYLSEKLQELGRMDILNVLKAIRKEVVDDARADTMELMTWLYAHQGEMRFGAENRLFIILVDTTDMSQSWKMKRAFSLMEPLVNTYLDNFNSTSLKEINFSFKKNSYRSLSDVLFVVKE